MTFLNALSEFLAECKAIGCVPKTYFTDGQDLNFSVSPTGSDVTSRDILGNLTYTCTFTLAFREHVTTEPDREQTQCRVEAIQDWVNERSEAHEYPIMPPGYIVRDMTANNTQLADVDNKEFGEFKIQIQLVILKEGVCLDG